MGLSLIIRFCILPIALRIDRLPRRFIQILVNIVRTSELLLHHDHERGGVLAAAIFVVFLLLTRDCLPHIIAHLSQWRVILDWTVKRLECPTGLIVQGDIGIHLRLYRWKHLLLLLLYNFFAILDQGANARAFCFGNVLQIRLLYTSMLPIWGHWDRWPCIDNCIENNVIFSINLLGISLELVNAQSLRPLSSHMNDVVAHWELLTFRDAL